MAAPRRNYPIALTAQCEPRRCVYPGPDRPPGCFKHGTAACTISASLGPPGSPSNWRAKSKTGSASSAGDAEIVIGWHAENARVQIPSCKQPLKTAAIGSFCQLRGACSKSFDCEYTQM